MAKITASVYTSHVPAIGAAIDLGKTQEPYWQPVFKGYDFSKQWMKDNKPDVIFLVYNDHATAFSLEMIPTFAIGTAAEFTPADEGWGPRPVPMVHGHPELASHIAQSRDPAGLRPHHRQQDGRGPRPDRAAVADVRPAAKAWPCPVIPFAVNVVQYPVPSGPALLQARQGHPQGGGELRRRPQRADLGHRRHEPPAAGPARRPDQQGIRQRLPRPADRRPGGAAPTCRTSTTCAKPAPKASSS